ncbi:MAG TPA: PepSY domain-containing protein [Gaiellaceae bacterium]|jgi:uncharacterized membrane protein YkoI
MSGRLKKIGAGLAAIAALALGGAALAHATGVGDEDGSLSGSTAQRAHAAALKATGGGEVTASERDGEKGATYEVEVRKPDGSTVDVRLDDHFGVVAIDGDSESHDSDDAGE